MARSKFHIGPTVILSTSGLAKVEVGIFIWSCTVSLDNWNIALIRTNRSNEHFDEREYGSFEEDFKIDLGCSNVSSPGHIAINHVAISLIPKHLPSILGLAISYLVICMLNILCNFSRLHLMYTKFDSVTTIQDMITKSIDCQCHKHQFILVIFIVSKLLIFF
jgi:hypothetical protein